MGERLDGERSRLDAVDAAAAVVVVGGQEFGVEVRRRARECIPEPEWRHWLSFGRVLQSGSFLFFGEHGLDAWLGG